MNKARRKQLQDVLSAVFNAKEELECIQGDEEEYRDNMPENLMNSDKYQIAEEAIDNIENAVSNLDEAISFIESAME